MTNIISKVNSKFVERTNDNGNKLDIVNTLFAITDEMMNKNTNPTATFIDDLHNLISKPKPKSPTILAGKGWFCH